MNEINLLEKHPIVKDALEYIKNELDGNGGMELHYLEKSIEATLVVIENTKEEEEDSPIILEP